MLKPLAFIFDLDGVLVDTVEAHYIGWRAVAKELGVPFSRECNDTLRGVARRDALSWLARNQPPLNPEREAQLLSLKAAAYREHVAATHQPLAIAGVHSLLASLRQLDIPLGLASASLHARTLLELAGLSGFFDSIADGAFAGKLKPDPGQLLHVSAQLNMSPASCVVVEDSAVGLEAARRAGMKSVAIGGSQSDSARIAHLRSLAGVSAQQLIEIVSDRSLHYHVSTSPASNPTA